MTRRRISVSLIAAAATTLALVSPAQAAEAEPGSAGLSSSLSSSAPAENEEPGTGETEDGGGGDEDGSPAEEPQGNLGSFAVTEEVELAFAVLEAIMAVGAATTTGLITYVKLVPGADAQVRDFLSQFGIQP